MRDTLYTLAAWYVALDVLATLAVLALTRFSRTGKGVFIDPRWW